MREIKKICVYVLIFFTSSPVFALPDVQQRLEYCKDTYIYSNLTLNSDLLIVEAKENGFSGDEELKIAINAVNVAFYELKSNRSLGSSASTFDWALGKMRESLGSNTNSQGLWISVCFNYLQKSLS